MLVLSPTVANYASNIFTKLHIADRVQAIVTCGRRALDIGVVLPHDDLAERTYRSWLSRLSKPLEAMSHR